MSTNFRSAISSSEDTYLRCSTLCFDGSGYVSVLVLSVDMWRLVSDQKRLVLIRLAGSTRDLEAIGRVDFANNLSKVGRRDAMAIIHLWGIISRWERNPWMSRLSIKRLEIEEGPHADASEYASEQRAKATAQFSSDVRTKILVYVESPKVDYARVVPYLALNL